jgi:hypothetical protein
MQDQKTKESYKPNDEIDLGLVFNRLFSFLKSILIGVVKTLFQIIDRIFNNIKIIITLVILGAIAGGLYFHSKNLILNPV